MMNPTLRITAEDGHAFDACVASPSTPTAPAVVLLQYICGVNRVMRALADGLAARGYLVLVPDLFARQQPGIALIDDPARPDPAEQQRALQLNAAFDDAAATLDLRATLAAARSHPRCDGRAGALGYCLGGRLAFLMATRTDVDCAVGYYGVNLQNYLEEADRIRRPLLMHMAADDMLVPPAVREPIEARLRAVPGVEVVVHPGVNHAFALPGGPNWNEAAARVANARSEAFLARWLRDGRA